MGILMNSQNKGSDGELEEKYLLIIIKYQKSL